MVTEWLRKDALDQVQYPSTFKTNSLNKMLGKLPPGGDFEFLF